MASSFKAELTCSVCLDLFQDPVLTRCEHTFCRRCVLEFWSQQQRNMCPLCRKVCPSAQLLRNRVLGGLLDTLRQRENVQLCSHHRLERSLYCPEDQELLCCQCRESPRHRGHNVLAITDARARYKEEIENTLKLLQDKRNKCEGLKTKSDKYIAKLQDWARQTESQIKNSFRKLHVYLNGEESSLIQQVRQEERESSRKLQDMTKEVFQQLRVLQNNIQEVERHMQDGILDLKGLKNIQARLVQTLPTPVLIMHKVPFGKFAGPMEYKVWKKLRKLVDTVPTTLNLDPDSAHPSLEVTADGSAVRLSEQRPSQPVCSRLALEPCVLAAQGFSGGCHYWEVEVAGEGWALGVGSRAALERGRLALAPQAGNWPLTFRGGAYECFHPLHTLAAGSQPRRLGVFLNLERGYLSFYDARDMSHIFTVPSKSSERLYPCFVPPSSGEPLSVARSVCWEDPAPLTPGGTRREGGAGGEGS